MPERAAQAMNNFFRKGNLIALRELALRRTADRVDARCATTARDRLTQRLGRRANALLVCVGPDAEARQAGARRQAPRDAPDAEWIVVYVETPRAAAAVRSERNRRIDALRLAESLGAETRRSAVHRSPRRSSSTRAPATSRGWWSAARPAGLAQAAFPLAARVAAAPADGLGRHRRRQRQPVAGAPLAAGGTHAGDAGRRGRRRRAALAGLRVVAVDGDDPPRRVHIALTPRLRARQHGDDLSAQRRDRSRSTARPSAMLSALLGVAAFDFLFVPPRSPSRCTMPSTC